MLTFTRFFRRTAKNMVEVTFDITLRARLAHSPVLITLREKLHPMSVNQIALTIADARCIKESLDLVIADYDQIFDKTEGS